MNIENRDNFVDLLNKLFPKGKGVELGSFKGEYAAHILKNWDGKIYMVDVWRPLSTEDYNDATNHTFHSDAYSQTMENIKGYENRAFMLRMTTDEASKLFADESLDFIYIDAEHTYEAVKKDIQNWYRKVKSGGLVMGHDYLPDYFYDGKEEKNQPLYTYVDGRPEDAKFSGMFGVKPAVDEFAKENGYTINKTNEFLASWWFIKK